MLRSKIQLRMRHDEFSRVVRVVKPKATEERLNCSLGAGADRDRVQRKTSDHTHT